VSSPLEIMAECCMLRTPKRGIADGSEFHFAEGQHGVSPRFGMEASTWEILPRSPRRVATPFDQRLGSDDRPVLERRFPPEASGHAEGILVAVGTGTFIVS
jgi:hypothetical protein